MLIHQGTKQIAV